MLEFQNTILFLDWTSAWTDYSKERQRQGLCKIQASIWAGELPIGRMWKNKKINKYERQLTMELEVSENSPMVTLHCPIKYFKKLITHKQTS